MQSGVARGLAIVAAGLLLASAARAERGLELVLTLDTTGSMGGLIERAKAELWGIVDQVSAASSTGGPGAEPLRVRIGLVAFRDEGDEYVTRVHDLTDDIDAVHGHLMSLSAGGGGDTPEAVDRALADSVGQIQWSTDASVQRAIILAGDAPPHVDRVGEVPWPITVREARGRGIAIHAIQLGSIGGTREVWQAIAAAGGGSYAALAGNPEHANSSPWDGELASLGRALNSTWIPYGDEAARAEADATRKRADDASDFTAAARVSFLGRRGRASTAKEGDLVAKLRGGELTWSDIEEDRLPGELREQQPEQRRTFVEDQIDRRRGLLSEVAYYAGKRDAYLQEARERDPARAFAQQVVEALLAHP